MAIRLHILSSDVVQDTQFLNGLKERTIDQMLMYRGDIAKKFCNIWNQRWSLTNVKDVPTTEELTEVFRKHIDKNKKTAIVSVGCGDAAFEDIPLQTLAQEGYSFRYYGVDSSRDMLDLAAARLENVSYEVNLMFADFMTSTFLNEMPNLTAECDDAVFLFLGSTLGNMSQTAAIDSLYNLMNKGERLFIEVGMRPSLTQEGDIKVFKKAKERLQDPVYNEIYFHQLKNAGMSFDDGRMVLDTAKEESAGVIKLTYSFMIEKKTTMKYRGEILHLLPPEKIKLQDIRMYYHDTFVRFIAAHDFTLLESVVRERIGLFVFEK